MYTYILFKKTLKVIGAIFLVTLLSQSSLAQQETKFSIFEVRKRLPLSNDENPVKDYYVSEGREAGLKVGYVIDVKRQIPIHDSFTNTSRGNLEVTIGKLKIIHVDKSIAVGRLFFTSNTDRRPITGFETIMIGDYLDISTAAMLVPKKDRKAASVDSSKKKPKKRKKQVIPGAQHAFMGPPLELLDDKKPLPIQVH